MHKHWLFTVFLCLICLGIGGVLGNHFDSFFSHTAFFSPLVSTHKQLPLLQYSIPRLQNRNYQPSPIFVIKVIQDFPEYTAYEFSYTTLGKKMTGQLNIPKAPASSQQNTQYPVIVMIRGFVPLNIYKTGVGTKNAAAVLAQHGYVTFAPDFFGYGDSDPENTDAWEARFQKPVEVIELIKSIETQAQLQLDPSLTASLPHAPSQVKLNPQHLGIWAHSNGGQIALTTLEILRQPIPTTLWAPVTAPFPYSILYFSDEDPDEGKITRASIESFEESYNVFDFSLTQHLDALAGPLQIHQGLQDEAIHYTWSQEFVDKLKAEDQRRTSIPASQSASLTSPKIDVTFFTYPDTDHNMRPSWDTVIARDVEFFAKNL